MLKKEETIKHIRGKIYEILFNDEDKEIFEGHQFVDYALKREDLIYENLIRNLTLDVEQTPREFVKSAEEEIEKFINHDYYFNRTTIRLDRDFEDLLYFIERQMQKHGAKRPALEIYGEFYADFLRPNPYQTLYETEMTVYFNPFKKEFFPESKVKGNEMFRLYDFYKTKNPNIFLVAANLKENDPYLVNLIYLLEEEDSPSRGIKVIYDTFKDEIYKIEGLLNINHPKGTKTTIEEIEKIKKDIEDHIEKINFHKLQNKNYFELQYHKRSGKND